MRLANVCESCGRRYLDVGGITLVVEDDICRDPFLSAVFGVSQVGTWNQESLQCAADKINKAVGPIVKNAIEGFLEDERILYAEDRRQRR